MNNELFNFLLNIPLTLSEFGAWLVEPLPYVNMSPLALFGLSGITLLLGIHLLRLFVGG